MTQDNTGRPPQASAKRRAPPQVPAVTLDGVRYEQAVLARDDPDGPRRTGWLVAFKGATAERLWRVRVYELKIDPALEGDVQDVYFASMAASQDGRELLIVDERGERFAVNLKTRKVRRLD